MDQPLQLLINAGLLVITVVGFWKVFEKAGQPGWVLLLPIFNLYVLMRIAGRPGWWLLLLLVPGVNLVVLCLMWHGLSQRFGHDALFTVGLAVLTPFFILILGLGEARYVGKKPVIPY